MVWKQRNEYVWAQIKKLFNNVSQSRKNVTKELELLLSLIWNCNCKLTHNYVFSFI